jgi:hypothetical protein
MRRQLNRLANRPDAGIRLGAAKPAMRKLASKLRTHRRHRSTFALSALTDLDVQHFASIVGEGNAITDASALVGYNTDWMKKCGRAADRRLSPR